MTLVGLRWHENAGYDLHLVPGLASPRFKQLLFAEDQDPGTGEVTLRNPNDMQGLQLSFAAGFLGAPDAHGVKVNMNPADSAHGEVTVGQLPPPQDRLFSFLLEVKAVQGAAEAKTRIRVHLHGSIVKLWLTPGHLTLRAGSGNMRCSVLAEFDDGVIGDISNWSPFQALASGGDFRAVHAIGNNTPLLAWGIGGLPHTPPSPVNVDPITGVLSTSEIDRVGSIKVTFQGLTAEAMVTCTKRWDAGVPVTQVIPPKVRPELVGPGVAGMNDVPNILFLPDGFVESERTQFERIVRGAVARLTSRNRTRPFGYLRINYFMAWVPSFDGGVSALDEAFESYGEQPTTGTFVEQLGLPSEKPPTDNWELADLFHHVGLPTPKFDGHPNVTLPAKLAQWRKVYGTHVTQPRVMPGYGPWLDSASRVILNERDTAFHTAFGSRPHLTSGTAARYLLTHPRRLSPADFNAFLDALEGPQGQDLPNVWSTGKDNDLVVMICRSLREGGSNSTRPGGPNNPGRLATVSLGRRDSHHALPTVLGGVDLVAHPIPTGITDDIWLTLAHELGHSWTLGDEYAEFDSAPTALDLQFTDRRANLQGRNTLISGGNLVADNIKWGRWPRISKAGVLVAAVRQVLNDRFIATVESNLTAKFEVDDIVRLRSRPLPASAGHSDRFRVIAVNGDEVTITPMPGSAVNPATLPGLFPPRGPNNVGSILMEPVRAADPNPAAGQYGVDLTMISDVVRQRINFTHNPLNAHALLGEKPLPPWSLKNRDCLNVVLPTPTVAANFPRGATPSPPLNSYWIIGLYENGGYYNCGIYRPTGVCLMHSNVHADERWRLNLNDFCMVCRYAIVDLIDPARHGLAEADFRQRYG